MVLMTEAPQSFLTPQSTPEEVKTIKSLKRDAKTILSNSEAENGGDEKPRKSGRPGTDQLLSVDPESDVSESKRKTPLMRSKIVEQALLLQSPSDGETKQDKKKSQSSQFSKTNEQYHKLFKEVSKDELLSQSYTCALQKDILYQGKLYISDNWICFHSKVFGKDTKIAVPVRSVTLIKKTKTAILVPNAIVIATAQERHMFVSFLSRDTTYKFLKSVCLHLDGPKAGSSPLPSSADSSFRAARPSSLPLDFSGDFSDLDGTVRQRRHNMLESSSSGSQTPDYEKMEEFPRLSQNFLGSPKNGEVAAHADSPHQKTTDPKHGPLRNGQTKPVGAVQKAKQQQSVSLNTLLLIYLFLVCILALSSCYMAFKIVCLEQRLNSLGSLGEYSHNENMLHHTDQLEVANAEIYGELSTNLFKLEKVQRNLQKLLEET
ncbi:GRAM domain-containing protein 2B-like [Megalops cyprinoides]|uniref:GRAM domain-containing protein 2B-like n=1 Tax=Megalops cyprinoides TaxID=118141 RepID=UPI001864A3A0|nr:GRAM domain-containing protein 2B-like [Megalops cyprinoides]